ncbi:cell wall hydrolase [Roseibium sp.]|uniref:cell wall hydrolase n=1 Tax=Roseibium sp. TaxID=1936156 RepID=UPI003A976AD0
MSGPRKNPSSRQNASEQSRARAPRKVPSRKRNKLKRILLTAPFAFMFLTGSIGQQDILSLLSEKKAEAPRWMMALEPARFATEITPTLSLASAPREAADPLKAPHLALASASKGADATTIKGLSKVALEVAPTEIPDKIAVNRSTKGDRFISMAPDRQMVDMSAGAVYAMSSMISNEKKQKDLPRVAFVKPEPLDKDHSRRLKGGAAAGTEGGPLDLQKVMMARNAAAASFSLVSAYAPESVENTKEPFQALFGAAKYEQELPPPEDPENPHWWAQKPLPLSVGTKKEQRCLAEAIYFEARGESEEGQVAVAQVVLNRVKNPSYPDTICGVVYQNKHKRNRCQFSFACDGIKDRITQPKSWKTAERLAKDVIGGTRYLKMVDASTHYHANYVAPRWRKSMAKRGQIGLHIFYKTYAGGWN